MKKHTNNRSRAFTLIEMLVVIAIIAILTGIIVANFAAARSRSRDAKRVSDIAQIQLALEQYFDRCQQYPSTISGTGSNNGCQNVNGISMASYITQIPTPPAGFGQGSYDYLVPSTYTDYILHASLENNTGDGLSNSYLTNFVSSYQLASPSWHCNDPVNYPKDYCVGPK